MGSLHFYCTLRPSFLQLSIPEKYVEDLDLDLDSRSPGSDDLRSRHIDHAHYFDTTLTEYPDQPRENLTFY